MSGTSDVQASRHLIPQSKEAEQSYGAYTYSARAFMAHGKLEMRDESLSKRVSLHARWWGRTSITQFSAAIVMHIY